MERFTFSFLLEENNTTCDAPWEPSEVDRSMVELTEVVLDVPKRTVPCI